MSVPFVTFKNNLFEFNQEAEKYLIDTLANCDIGVVSMLNRSSKMSNLLWNQETIGESVCRVSENNYDHIEMHPNIYLRKEIIKSTNVDNQQINTIILDLKFNNLNELGSHRMMVFPLILSSYLIYNTDGNINEDQIKSLAMIVNCAREIQLQIGQQEVCSYFPLFHWILNEFDIDSSNKFEERINEKQYLENCLEQLKGISESVEQRNRIRRNFKEFFKQRQCSIISKKDIVENEQSIQDLLGKINKRIFRKLKVKRFENKKVTVKMFIEMNKNLILNLNQGTVPNMRDFWNKIYLTKQKTIVHNIENGIHDRLQNQLRNYESLPQLHQIIEYQMRSIFQKQSLCGSNPSQQIKLQLIKSINTLKNYTQKQLEVVSLKTADQKIEDLYQSIKNDIQNGRFSNIYELKQQIQLIRTTHQQLFNTFTIEKQFEIETDMKLLCFESLCLKYQMDNCIETSKDHFYSQQLDNLTLINRQKDHQIEQLNNIVRRLQQELKILKEKQSNQNSSDDKQLELTRMKLEKEEMEYKINQMETIVNSIDEEYKQKYRFMETEIEQLNTRVAQLQNEKQQTEKIIEETETKIVHQIQKQEMRIRDILQNAQAREKEKDLMIQKLERILRELKIRKNEELGVKNYQLQHQIIKIKEEFNLEKMKNHELKQAIQTLKDKLHSQEIQHINQIKQLDEEKISILKNYDASKSIMESFRKGLEVKVATSPKSRPKDWQVQKLYYETQLAMLQNLSTENQKLITTFIEREKLYEKQNQTLKMQLSDFKESIKKIKQFYCNSCNLNVLQTFEQHECKKQINKLTFRQTEHWLFKNCDRIILSVPLYFIKEVDSGHSVTHYLIELRVLSEKKWTIKRRFKDVCQLKRILVLSHPEIKEPKFNSSTKIIQERRKEIEEFLKQCLRISEYRNHKQFKRFLCDENYKISLRNSSSKYRGSPEIHNYQNMFEESYKNLRSDQGLKIIDLNKDKSVKLICKRKLNSSKQAITEKNSKPMHIPFEPDSAY